eukprot:640203_1
MTTVGFIPATKYLECSESNPEPPSNPQPNMHTDKIKKKDQNDDNKQFRKPSHKLHEFNEYLISIDLDKDQSDQYFVKTPTKKHQDKTKRLSHSGQSKRIRCKTAIKLKEFDQFIQNVDYSLDVLDEYKAENKEMDPNPANPDIPVNNENTNASKPKETCGFVAVSSITNSHSNEEQINETISGNKRKENLEDDTLDNQPPTKKRRTK